MTRLPNPMGCARCGIDQRGHAIQAGTDGTHTWQKPTQQQIKDRMHARRATGLFASSLRNGVDEWKAQGVDSAEAAIRKLENQLYAEDPSDQADAYHALQSLGYVDEDAAAGQEQEPRVKHSGPHTKFCVLCLSGEHERVDDE